MMFTYIKPEFMVQAFLQQRDTVLKERSICVARLGDMAVNMSMVDEETFTLSLEDVTNGTQYSGRVFNIDAATKEEAAEMVNGMFHRMQMINDQEVFEKRERIWKWYAMQWLDDEGISLDEYIDSWMGNDELKDKVHWKTFEDYISSDYLNVMDTMSLIEKFALTEEEKMLFQRFVAKDIVELRQNHSFQNVQESFNHEEPVFKNKKSFTFGIEVVADSREEARKKLKGIIEESEDGGFYIIG